MILLFVGIFETAFVTFYNYLSVEKVTKLKDSVTVCQNHSGENRDQLLTAR